MSTVRAFSGITIWDEEREKRFAYLWYMGKTDTKGLSAYTTVDKKRCINKKGSFPDLSKYDPVELFNNITNTNTKFTSLSQVYQCAETLFKEKPNRSFDQIVTILMQQGLKSPDEIYEFWRQKYSNLKNMPRKIVPDFLSGIYTYRHTKTYSWVPVEKELYKNYQFDVTANKLSALFRSMEGEKMIEAAETLLQLQKRV